MKLAAGQPSVHLMKTFMGGYMIAYFAPLGGRVGVNAALVMQQLLYWTDKTKNPHGWFYKTESELYKETALTGKQQRLAIRKLKGLGLIETKLAGIPAKRHFRVNLARLVDFLKTEVLPEWQARTDKKDELA